MAFKSVIFTLLRSGAASAGYTGRIAEVGTVAASALRKFLRNV